MYRPTRRVEGAHRDGIWAVYWSNDAIITGSLDGTAKLWKEDLSLIETTPEQRLGITSIVSLNNNQTVVSCCQDSIIRFHSMPSLKQYAEIDPGHLEAYSISVSKTEDLIAAGSHTGNVHIWSVSNQEKLYALKSSDDSKFFLSTDFNNDDTKLVAANMIGTVFLYDLATQQIVHKIDAHGMPIRKVKFSKDGNLLYTASDDKHVSVFDTRNGSSINSFSHTGMSLTVDVSPDHRHFLVGCADHTVVLWDLGMQRQEQLFEVQHTDQVWGVSYDETGNRFISVGDDALLQLYERSTT
mmetsp:Transcript_19726/g.19833  ORF Transcript_19726/g.19833 Transcript_19726/m.19833 type:complete len:297 (+) Transcript_19726:41-931(+)